MNRDDWLATIRARLAHGPATTSQLAEACGCEVRGPFAPFLYEALKDGTLVVTTKGPKFMWDLK